MSELIKTLSLWTEFNTVVKKGRMACGLTSLIQLISTPCDFTKSCGECFFKIDQEIQDKTVESLDRHTGWKL